MRVLDDLNNLYLKRNYPTKYSDLVTAPYIEELDEYLGSLGISVEYQYSKDAVDISPWITVEGGVTEIRVLVDYTDGTYLTYGENEILVRV